MARRQQPFRHVAARVTERAGDSDSHLINNSNISVTSEIT
jgi:hypothetical protein